MHYASDFMNNDFRLIYKKITQKYSADLSPERSLFLCLLFDLLHTTEFLMSDSVKTLSENEKRNILVSFANVFVRDYVFNDEIVAPLKESHDPIILSYLDEFTDMVSSIIAFCNQAAPQEKLNDLLNYIPEKVEKILEKI